MLEQLQAAGVAKQQETDPLTEKDKAQLLEHLRFFLRRRGLWNILILCCAGNHPGRRCELRPILGGRESPSDNNYRTDADKNIAPRVRVVRRHDVETIHCKAAR